MEYFSVILKEKPVCQPKNGILMPFVTGKGEFVLATIKDIANRLGISVSTVSKGLNGASDISEELRQTVLDTAVEMGYATKRSKKIENRKLALFIENI